VTLDVIADHRCWDGTSDAPIVLPGSARTSSSRTSPHVVVLDAAAETGVIGLFCYIALLIGPWVAWPASAPDGRRLAGTSAALAAVAMIGLFDFY
jgi:O-antigen ligase